MKTEVIIAGINTEIKPNNQLKVFPNSNLNFLGPEWARLQRNQIIPVSPNGFSSVIILERPQTQVKTKGQELVEMSAAAVMPKIEEIQKSLSYNPSKKAKEYVDQYGKRILRVRRKSRCDGVHDAEENPCGSARCKTKGKVKINPQAEAEKKRKARRRVVFGRSRKRIK